MGTRWNSGVSPLLGMIRHDEPVSCGLAFVAIENLKGLDKQLLANSWGAKAGSIHGGDVAGAEDKAGALAPVKQVRE
jgi:hypothetical protein